MFQFVRRRRGARDAGRDHQRVLRRVRTPLREVPADHDVVCPEAHQVTRQVLVLEELP